MSDWYDLSEWLCCPNCSARDPEYLYSADDGTSAYKCEDCGAKVEVY